MTKNKITTLLCSQRIQRETLRSVLPGFPGPPVSCLALGSYLNLGGRPWLPSDGSLAYECVIYAVLPSKGRESTHEFQILRLRRIPKLPRPPPNRGIAYPVQIAHLPAILNPARNCISRSRRLGLIVILAFGILLKSIDVTAVIKLVGEMIQQIWAMRTDDDLCPLRCRLNPLC